MLRPVIELLFTIAVVLIARAVLSSIMKSIARASSSSFPNAQPGPGANRASGNQQAASTAGELHKDPVCGTYVAESGAYKRMAGGQTFYYCSAACREKHSLVAR